MNRDQLRDMFGGKCAYCGQPLGRVFHADHVAPLYRGWTRLRPKHAGDDAEANIVPTCPRCKIRKGVLSLEDFRAEIAMQPVRLSLRSPAFRLAEDFGLIAKTREPVVFWFERYRVQATETRETIVSEARDEP